MTPEAISFAISGLLLGWVVRDFLGKRRLDPNIVRGAHQQIEQIRADLGGQLEREKQERASDKEAFLGMIRQSQTAFDHWMHRHPPQQEVPHQPFPDYQMESEVDIERQVRLATNGEKMSQARQDLVDRGLTPMQADAILEGRYEDLGTGEKVDTLVAEAIRRQTGVV